MSEKYFESQQEDEDVIILVRRHIIALVPVIAMSALLYLIGLLAVLVFPFILPVMVQGFAYNIYVIVVSLLFLFTTIFVFNNWVLHYLHVAILTTEHLVEIDQAGLFSRKISELALEKIQDVSSSQEGLINTMFDIGEVEIQTAGEAPNFVIEYAPDPSKTAQKIMETEEIYCEKHGIRTGANSSNANNNTTLNQPTIEYPGGEWEQK
jgi:uncharacterized membrane protein YdbT with pleckstrin-like domain